MEENQKYDVVIVGGSYAGLSAALALGRSIRKVLVIDSGKPCNSQTPYSHNFLTQDCSTPAAIYELAKSQVMAYPTVEFQSDTVITAEGENNRFTVSTQAGKQFSAKKILFATGVTDQIDAIPGLAECWGISVIHCPYCHGYEFNGQPTGLLANGDEAADFVRLIRNWTDKLVIFTNGKSTISDKYTQQLLNRNITLSEKEIKRLIHRTGQLDAIEFTDGDTYNLSALYTQFPVEQHCDIPEKMGCSLIEAGYIQIDTYQKTTVPGIYAAGDNTSALRSVAAAVASGSKAGACIHHELVSEDVWD
jgi:thioredoxin reductase